MERDPESTNIMNQNNGYSSATCGWLELGDRRLPLAQVGPGFCILRQGIDAPQTEAELVIAINGSERRKRVFLTPGIAASSTLVELTAR